MSFLKGESFRAAAMLAGAIIGVGIFGVPYAFAQAGVAITTALFVVLAGVVLLLHVMLAEVVERTQGTHRLVGYASRYLGTRGKVVETLSLVVGTLGALVAYILVAGQFLSVLLGAITPNPFIWEVLFWAAMSIGILLGMRTISRIEAALVGVLVVTFSLIIARSVPDIHVVYWQGVHLQNIFLPYGVILFALIGLPAIPQIRDAAPSRGPHYRNAIIAGTLIPVVLTYAFALAVAGVTGSQTSPEAISGLIPAFGPMVALVGAFVGVLAITTSYLVFGLNVRDTLLFDLRMGKSISNVLVVGVPIALILVGIQSIVEVLSFTGAVFGAVDGTLVILLFRQAKKRGRVQPSFSMTLPGVAYPLLIAALVAGGVYSLVEIAVK